MGCAETGESVTGVVDVPAFAGLVPQSSFLEVLTVEEDVSLEIFFGVEQMVVVGSLPFEVIIDDVENAAHPVRIARIDQLICPSVETSELGLSLREPKHQTRHIQILQPLQQSQRSHSAKGKPAVCLSSDHIRNASLVSLGQQHRLCDSFEDVSWQIECNCDEGDYIYGSEVAFSLLVHHKLPAFLAFLEELVQFLPVQQIVSIRPEL